MSYDLEHKQTNTDLILYYFNSINYLFMFICVLQFCLNKLKLPPCSNSRILPLTKGMVNVQKSAHCSPNLP